MNKNVLLFLLLLLAGCSPMQSVPVDKTTDQPYPLEAPTSSPVPGTTGSGIEGQAVIGPMCPVVKEGVSCPNQPYRATLTVNNLKGEKIVQFQTDDQGRFHLSLPPGDYILHPESTGKYPRAPEQTFTVTAGKFTQLTVTFESGIR